MAHALMSYVYKYFGMAYRDAERANESRNLCCRAFYCIYDARKCHVFYAINIIEIFQ